MEALISHTDYAKAYQKQSAFCAGRAHTCTDIMDGLPIYLMPSLTADYLYWADKAASHASKARFHLFKALEA